MNQSLSKEKEQAQRTTTSEVCVHRSGTTAFMPEEGAIGDEEAKRAHAYQIDPELSSPRESPRTNGSSVQNAPYGNPWSINERPVRSRGKVEPYVKSNDTNRFDEKASFNWPKQVPRSMPRMPRRITNCNGCG
eukprot:448845-Karenia_brevis.AAC.1